MVPTFDVCISLQANTTFFAYLEAVYVPTLHLSQWHDIGVLFRMFILGLWHACHASISLTVAIKANDVKQLLDPVSSGIVTL